MVFIIMRCSYCHSTLAYIHGHAACLRHDCAMFGLNQSECCSGEQGECLPTSAVAARTPAPEQQEAAPPQREP
jgi:hypothetical protein